MIMKYDNDEEENEDNVSLQQLIFGTGVSAKMADHDTSQK